DYAKETAALSRAQVLNQSSIGVMSMINFIRQQVMNALMG
ncbi:MAG: flagellin FliC, partial [Planctomycetes bacterium]|nr:flagellin FliC [Planctomycetota bacterium]